MMIWLRSKGNNNPAGISHSTSEHASEVVSFVARNTFLGIVVGTAGIGALIAILLGAFLFGGIVFSLFAAF
jgi:tetrahydromethanopterin S-methyltransferase subunit B